jgi:hypothetical protein
MAVTLLPGCGAEEAIAPDDVAKAAEATIQAGGAKLATKGTITAPDGKQVDISGRGEVDKRGSTELEMELSAAGETQTMRLVVAGELLFMSSSLFEDLPDGKEWVRIDYEKVADQAGLSDLPEVGSSDPSGTLRNLRAVAEVEKVGSEDVRGVPTTHYTATIRLRDLPDKVRPGEREAARRSVERLIKLTGSEEQKTEVWIDRDDLVRRTRDQYTMSPGPKKVEVDETTEFYGFGTRATIEVPADSESVDITKLAAREARKQSR